MKKSKNQSTKAKLQICELFAGVGGFRLGFEGKTPAMRRRSGFKTVWANQWEPSSKMQHAANVYRKTFGDGIPHFNEDIGRVLRYYPSAIPDHDILCGGFPCQDYSVARSVRGSAGIHGKKGVLWWSIHKLLKLKLNREKKGRGRAARYLVLENVDRLLKSPKGQRGRDFAVMLASLNLLGYTVEWRVVDSSLYGFPQRRKRVFIVAYRHKSGISAKTKTDADIVRMLNDGCILSKAFPVKSVDAISGGQLYDQRKLSDATVLANLTEFFNKGRDDIVFRGAGIAHKGRYWTTNPTIAPPKSSRTLGDVLQSSDEVDDEYFIPSKELPRWRAAKGAKRIWKTSRKSGIGYWYQEGAIAFPDSARQPSRTVITGEGGRSVSRFKHVVKSGRRHRRLTPLELERLNGFPDGYTKLTGVPDSQRAFLMGNALVVGCVAKIAKVIYKLENQRSVERRETE